MTEPNHCSAQASILDLYTRLAQHPENEFGWDHGKASAARLGYFAKWLDSLPDPVWESAAPVGNPFALGAIHPADTVVDLGCGAGADLCIAASLAGRAIGIDFTAAMVEKARDNVARAGLGNASVHQADIASLPLPDSCADVVISNGAINLAGDKTRVFREIHRILKPGGRLQFADMARVAETGPMRCDSWADCVSGTLAPERTIELLQQAGLIQAEHYGFTGYRTSDTTEGALFRAVKPQDR